MTVALGFVPIDCTVALSAGGDFSQTLTATPPWPAGTAVELHFSPTPAEGPSTIVWPATISGANATWNVPAVSVAAVLNAQALYVTIHYVTSIGTLVWMVGRVRVS